jgi:phosphatidate phosphatase LPIN
MREIVDHFFPPVGLLVPPGGEQFTDFNYWRERPLDIEDFTDSEDEDQDTEAPSVPSEDEGSEVGEDLEASFLTQASVDEAGELEDSIVESVETDEYEEAYEDEEGEIDEDEESEEDGEESEEDCGEEDEREELQQTPTEEPQGLAVGMRDMRLNGQTPTPTPQASPAARRPNP